MFWEGCFKVYGLLLKVVVVCNDCNISLIYYLNDMGCVGCWWEVVWRFFVKMYVKCLNGFCIRSFYLLIFGDEWWFVFRCMMEDG